MQSCASCMFFHVKSNWEKDFTAPAGHCRRRSPVIVDTCGVGTWPFVTHDMWCGDWALKMKISVKLQDYKE